MFTYADVSYILKFLHKPLLYSNSKVSAELFLVHVMMHVSWCHLTTLLFRIPLASLRVNSPKFGSHWKITLCKFVLPLGHKYLKGNQLSIFDRQNVVAWMIFLYRVTITSLVSENSIIYFKICIFYICATYMCIYAIENCKR